VHNASAANESRIRRVIAPPRNAVSAKEELRSFGAAGPVHAARMPEGIIAGVGERLLIIYINLFCTRNRKCAEPVAGDMVQCQSAR